jgi:hypothetical protein
MKTICVEADVTPTGILVAQMPESIKPGQHRIRIRLYDKVKEAPQKLEIVSIPLGCENAKNLYRREDIYGDTGR